MNLSLPPKTGERVTRATHAPIYHVNGKGRYTLAEARAVASSIFARSGVVVAITEIPSR